MIGVSGLNVRQFVEKEPRLELEHVRSMIQPMKKLYLRNVLVILKIVSFMKEDD